MKIHSAEFIVGAASPGQFPTTLLPEVAFAGKSNVGKSSVINALLNRKHLVKTSSTPGKTRQINFFNINEVFRLVDLPGYGFSRVPKSEQTQWEILIEHYLREGKFLKGVVLIIDVRHPPGPLDQAMVRWLETYGIDFLVLANKMDKLKRAEIPGNLKAVSQALSLSRPPIPFSAKTRQGREELTEQLTQWLPSVEKKPGARV